MNKHTHSSNANNEKSQQNSDENIKDNLKNENTSDEKEKTDKEEMVLSEKIKEMEKELKDKEEQISQLKNSLIRLHAEFDNFRKRSSREKVEFCKYAQEKLMQELLPIMDNFDSAFLAVNKIEQNQSIKSFIDGISISYKSLKDVLAKEGLREINACGEQFNPSVHDAVQMIECTDHPDECIIEEIQKGYYLADKILRHPKVKVAKRNSNKI